MQSLSLDGKNNFSIKQNSMRLRVAVVSMVTHAVRVIIGGITLTSITMITSVMWIILLCDDESSSCLALKGNSRDKRI